MRLSKTGLNIYDKCPYSYFLKYIQHVPVESSEAMDKGIEFHENADGFFDKVDLDYMSTFETQLELKAYLASLLPDMTMYKNFAHIEATHYMNLTKKEEFIPIEREFKVDLHEVLGEENVPDWCLDIGYIDWIAEVDGETVLGEYKSGKYRQGINQELMMYKDLIEQGTDYKIDKLCAIFPMELYGVKLPTGVYYKSPSHEKFARAKVERVKKAIRAGQWYKKKFSMCQWCGVSGTCYENDAIQVR